MLQHCCGSEHSQMTPPEIATKEAAVAAVAAVAGQGARLELSQQGREGQAPQGVQGAGRWSHRDEQLTQALGQGHPLVEPKVVLGFGAFPKHHYCHCQLRHCWSQ
jgi:hypothetical protein